jgi:hypothetical protein
VTRRSNLHRVHHAHRPRPSGSISPSLAIGSGSRCSTMGRLLHAGRSPYPRVDLTTRCSSGQRRTVSRCSAGTKIKVNRAES